MLDSRATSPSGHGEKRRILFIDDSRFVRRLFSVMFEGLGYVFEGAESGHEGLWKAARSPYDVVVVDGLLHDMDGREVCRRLARLPGEKPVLVLYSASNRVYLERHEAAREGVDLSLRKDATGELLVAHVERLLDARRVPRTRAPVA